MFVSLFPLLVLDVLALPAQATAERPGGWVAERVGVVFFNRAAAQGELKSDRLLVAHDLHFDLVFGLVIEQGIHERVPAQDGVAVEAHQDVIFLEARLRRRPIFSHCRHARANSTGALPVQSHVRGVETVLGDAFRFDHGVHHVRVGDVPVDTDASQGH